MRIRSEELDNLTPRALGKGPGQLAPPRPQGPFVPPPLPPPAVDLADLMRRFSTEVALSQANAVAQVVAALKENEEEEPEEPEESVPRPTAFKATVVERDQQGFIKEVVFRPVEV